MRSLDAICETFAPGAVEQGVPDAVLDAIEHDLSRRERQRLQLLLRTWLPGYSRLSQSRREAVLRGWRDSPVPLMRTGFQALRKAALAFAYMLPGRWEEIGYPGPLGPRADAPAPRLEPIEPPTASSSSSATSASSARAPAAASRPQCSPRPGSTWSCSRRAATGRSATSTAPSATGLRRLYRGGGASATDDQGVGLIAGACLGGGTVVNYTTSFRTPDDVLEEWEGLGFPSAELGPSLDAVCERLGVNTEHNLPSRRDEVMRRGLESLGWHVDAMPRDVVGCDQGVVCGYCGYGCPLGAKQSTVRTWLEDAAAAGARIVVGTKARRVLVENGPRRRRRRRAGAGARARRRRRRGRDRDARAAAPLRPDEPEHRPLAATAPGDGGLRDLRRGDPPVGGDDAGALLRPAPPPRRRLRGQVRDRPGSSRRC